MSEDVPKKEIYHFYKPGRHRKIAGPEVMWPLLLKYFEWKKTHTMERQELIKSGEGWGEIIQVPLQRPAGWEEFLMFCNVSKNYFTDMMAKDKPRYDTFSGVIEELKEIIRKQKFDGAALGLYHANIISRDLGLVDKAEFNGTIVVEQPGDGEDDE